MSAELPRISVADLELAFGSRIIQRDITFAVASREIFIIMGGSGCGKSTLLKHLVGLIRPTVGQVSYGNEDFWCVDDDRRIAIQRQFGVLFQNGALWSSMTLAENIGLPLAQFTRLRPAEISDLVALKLSLVGLKGFGKFYPAEISGGMRKRAALARAIALDPEILFFDEPSAGLDPISSRHLDDLILELRDGLGASIVIVTHELASIFAIGDNSIFLDAGSRRPIAHGNPRALLQECENPTVRSFLTRGGSARQEQRH